MVREGNARTRPGVEYDGKVGGCGLCRHEVERGSIGHDSFSYRLPVTEVSEGERPELWRMCVCRRRRTRETQARGR